MRIISFSLVALLFLSCSQPIVHNLSPDEFERQISDPRTIVVSVCAPEEGIIGGTDVWAGVGNVTNIGLPQNAPIAVYCLSGKRSANASQQLIDAGYRNVYALDGGMREWEESGRTLVDP